MDYGKLTLDELKKGYSYDKESNAYICSYCEQKFEIGQIYSIGSSFYMAEPAVTRHINTEHGGSFFKLITSDTKYNTLTQNQKELLTLMENGVSDKEIAKRLDITESTVRRQRFTFREKAKQAKFYLAVYEKAFETKSPDDSEIIPIHNNAVYVDDRYLITEKERQHILDTAFYSLNPLVLKNFPVKEKKKVVIMTKIAEQFERNKEYSEREVNQILKPIFDDYTTLRRYMIMYGLMERNNDCSRYWLSE